MNVMLIGTFLLVTFGCQKNNKIELSHTSSDNSSNVTIMNREIQDPKNKKANLDGGPNDPGCIEGEGYCVEVIVRPQFTAAFRQSIDRGTVSDFLTDSVIDVLSVGNDVIRNNLYEVKRGNYQIRYTEFPNSEGTKTGFFIGDAATNNFSISIVNTNE